MIQKRDGKIWIEGIDDLFTGQTLANNTLDDLGADTPDIVAVLPDVIKDTTSRSRS